MTMKTEIILHEEHAQIAGNAIDSGDKEYDDMVNAELLSRVLAGDLWAWCTVEVKVTIDGNSASEYLGCCSYKNEEDFISGGYCADMIMTCRETIDYNCSVDIVQVINEHKTGVTMALQLRNGNIVECRSSTNKKHAIAILMDVIAKGDYKLMEHDND